MKVAIYSNKIEVARTLTSMAASNGCKFTQLIRYNKMNIKGNDMLIVDLDNCEDSVDLISDILTLTEILIVGISSDDEKLNEYKKYIKVEAKPFGDKTFKVYKNEVIKKLESEQVINKDEDRTYGKFGERLAETLDTSSLSINDKIELLRKKITKSPAKIEPEEKFLKRTGLDDINIPIAEPINDYSVVPKVINIFKDEALSVYRIRKLRQMNLSIEDIDKQLDLLNNARTPNEENTNKRSNTQNEMIDRLKTRGANQLQEHNEKVDKPKVSVPAPKIDIPIKKKPIITIDSGKQARPQVKAPIITIPKAQTNIETKKNIPEVQKPIATIPIITTQDIKNDPLSILREQRKQNPVAKTSSPNNSTENVIKDNMSGSSLEEKIKRKMVGPSTQKRTEEELIQERLKDKTKPPR